MLAQSAYDAVVGLVPDWSGRIWDLRRRTRTFNIDARSTIRSLNLNKASLPVSVLCSISACPQGERVTSHAIYMLNATATGAPT